MDRQNIYDLIWGVAEIARVINRTSRQTYHLLSTGKLPVRKIGGRWCASREQLLAFLHGEI